MPAREDAAFARAASDQRLLIDRLLRDQIERIWGAGETALVDSNYCADVVDHMPTPGQPGGLAALKDVVRGFREALPDLRMTLHGVNAQGAFGVDFWTLEATHSGSLFGAPATGKRVRFSGIDMIRVVDGRIQDLWHVEELAQFERQIGLPEQPALADPRSERSLLAAQPLSDPAHLAPMEKRTLAALQLLVAESWVGKPLRKAEGSGDALADGFLTRGSAARHYPFMAALRRAAPDLRVTPEFYLVEGSFAAVRLRLQGRYSGAPLLGSPPTGKPFDASAMAVLEVGPEGEPAQVWRVEERARICAQVR